MLKVIKKRKSRKVTKKQIIITFLLFIIGAYLVIFPILPGVIFKLFYKGKPVYPYRTKLKNNIDEEIITSEKEDVPEGNRIVIPDIRVDMPIIEGKDEKALNLGVWHRPNTGRPGVGNMVLTGHRVGYAFLPEDIRNSISFYNLDKLEENDYVIVYWEGNEYDYEIYGSEIVNPNDIYIENKEGDERLTLYTCHPLGELSKRLVYYAKRV